ncbi:unnamed protein product [Linum tenue]|uniref:DUF7731 domain-containing protein n=1 Tax=Linum tenue TaxID=586396 RepID=A0AAV0P8H1_9ROSI|nr:unnamed protein product [Linum tenue]
MAASSTFSFAVTALLLVAILIISPFQLGKADEEAPYIDVGSNGVSGSTSSSSSSSSNNDNDPAEMVAKAMLCFNNRGIYRSCDEDFRLNESGRLGVPLEQVDAYCGGSCLTETNMVLDCLEGIMKNFRFYNTATIKDIKDTVSAGCSDGPERGNFDVSEHLEASESTVLKGASWGLCAIGYLIAGRALLRW